MEVRNLQVKDVFTVAKILGKTARGSKLQLLAILSDKTNTRVDPMVVGMDIFGVLFVDTGEDVKAWLADMCGKTKEEFDALDANLIFDVFEQLIKQKGARDFLSQLSSLMGKIMRKDFTQQSTELKQDIAGQTK